MSCVIVLIFLVLLPMAAIWKINVFHLQTKDNGRMYFCGNFRLDPLKLVYFLQKILLKNRLTITLNQ